MRKTTAPELDRPFRTFIRHGHFPRIALRERTDNHPMAMFATLVTVSFLSMFVMGPGRSTLERTFEPAPQVADHGGAAAKTSRLPPISDAGRACHGQAWGAETEDCLRAIVKQSGKGDVRKIRMIASADPLKTTPNVF